MSKVKTSVRLSKKAHARAKQEAKRQRRSISAQLEIYLEQLFAVGIPPVSNGSEVRIPEPVASVGAEP